MTVLRPGRERVSPDRSELLSITERARHLAALRLCLVGVAIGVCVLSPASATVPMASIVLTTAGYVVLSGGFAVVIARGKRGAAPLLQGGLLLDGIYLAALVAQTGGASSLLRFLPFGHVVGVTLLCSYRTGLKLTLWHTILFLWVVRRSRPTSSDLDPTSTHEGGGTDDRRYLVVRARHRGVLSRERTSASPPEGEPDRPVADGGSHRRSRAIGCCGEGDRRLLLDQVRTTFGFTRGIVPGFPGREPSRSSPRRRPVLTIARRWDG